MCCLASCNGKVVSLRVPGLHSSVLRALRCFPDCLGCPDCRSCGPGHSRGCTPFRSAGLQTFSRRTLCLGVLCRLGCSICFRGDLSPCRCTPCLLRLDCCSLVHRILSLSCNGHCIPWVLRRRHGQSLGMTTRRYSQVTGVVGGSRSVAPGLSCAGNSMMTRSVVAVGLGVVAVWGRRKPLLRAPR